MPEIAAVAVPTFTWYAFFSLVSLALGACLGSFLNVCIYRIPLGISVVMPRSFCPHCKTPIRWYDNIPLLSFILRAGRCRSCAGAISARYPLVEALTAMLFLLIWLKFDFGEGSRRLGLAPITDWRLVPVYWLVASGLVLGTFVDLEHLIIPDRVTLGGIVAGILLSIAVPSLHNEKNPLWSLAWSVLGAATGWLALWAIAQAGAALFKTEAMGFGDVKLMGAIGAFLGARAVLFSIMASSLVGSLVGLSMVLGGKKSMRSKIPYGPYLALAAVLWILWGEHFAQAYVRFFTSPPEAPL